MKLTIDLGAFDFDSNLEEISAKEEFINKIKQNSCFHLELSEYDYCNRDRRMMMFDIKPYENKDEITAYFLIDYEEAEILAKTILSIIKISNNKRYRE